MRPRKPIRRRNQMRPKRNTILKVGKKVVTFAGDGVCRAIGELGQGHSKQAGSLGPRGPPADADEIDPLLTVRETAALLRCSVHSLNKWRLTGSGPRFVRVGSRVRYRRSAIADFIEKSTRVSTSDTGSACAPA